VASGGDLAGVGVMAVDIINWVKDYIGAGLR
jgi:hypothetical protein